MLAHVAVFLHVAAGLAEKPYGSAINGTAKAGADKAASVENSVGGGFNDRNLIGWIHTVSILTGKFRSDSDLNHQQTKNGPRF